MMTRTTDGLSPRKSLIFWAQENCQQFSVHLNFVQIAQLNLFSLCLRSEEGKGTDSGHKRPEKNALHFSWPRKFQRNFLWFLRKLGTGIR